MGNLVQRNIRIFEDGFNDEFVVLNIKKFASLLVSTLKEWKVFFPFAYSFFGKG